MKWDGRKSIVFRLTLLFAAASTVVLLLLGYVIAGSVDRHFEEQDVDILNGKLKLTQHAVEKIKSQADFDALPQQLDDALVGHQGLAVVVVAPNGDIVYATNGADFPHALLEAGAKKQAARPMAWKTKDGQALRGIAALAYTGVAGEAPATVAVATDISMHEHFMRSFNGEECGKRSFARLLPSTQTSCMPSTSESCRMRPSSSAQLRAAKVPGVAPQMSAPGGALV